MKIMLLDMDDQILEVKDVEDKTLGNADVIIFDCKYFTFRRIACNVFIYKQVEVLKIT